MQKHTDKNVKKVTAILPANLLEMARLETGQGITETITEGLRHLARMRAGKEIAKLRGKVKFDMTWQELKELR